MRITVLYDGRCTFCVRCARWLASEPKYAAIELLDRNDERVGALFPELALDADELVVIDEHGGVYRDDRAFLMCLWALADYREISLRLSTPQLMPLARSFFRALSTGRTLFLKDTLRRRHLTDGALSTALDVELSSLRKLQMLPDDRCER